MLFRIQQALARLMIGRTTMIIAHRLSTIRNADLIAILQGSETPETGTHEELLVRDELYRYLNEVQLDSGSRWREMQKRRAQLTAASD